MIASSVDAGYAVVAPDLEGLGPVASGPALYYNAASSGRSIIAALQAARAEEPGLATRWVAIGLSGGGRATLAVEAYAGHASGSILAGIVALAPFASIKASVQLFGDRAKRDPSKAGELVVAQGTDDGFVPEPLTAAFAARMSAAGARSATGPTPASIISAT